MTMYNRVNSIKEKTFGDITEGTMYIDAEGDLMLKVAGVMDSDGMDYNTVSVVSGELMFQYSYDKITVVASVDINL